MKIKNMKQVKEHMKDMNMKRLFRRNQIIIITLAVMIAAAGYLNYAGKKDLANGNRVYEAGAMDISDEDILAENQAASLNGQAGLQEIQSLDQDPSDLDAVSNMDGAHVSWLQEIGGGPGQPLTLVRTRASWLRPGMWRKQPRQPLTPVRTRASWHRQKTGLPRPALRIRVRQC